jgi:hypothetical protein
MALGAVAYDAVAAVQRREDWEVGVIVLSVVAVLLGGCAVGTYFNGRVASLVGFALLLVVLAAGALIAASEGAIAAPVVLMVLLVAVPAIAGIVGTFATAGLLQSGEAHEERSTA